MPGTEAGGLVLGSSRRVHVVGMGGSGMSAIATVLAAMGHHVTGSDRAVSPALERLGAAGVGVTVGHDLAGVSDAEVVTASSAVPDHDPELLRARELGLTVVSRAGILAAICATRRILAVAGTKGKTTTAAMLAAVLEEAGWRPSYLIGGDLHGGAGGARWVPDSEWLVVEADESDGTFLQLGAEAAVVTNVEADHLDHFGDLAHLRADFVEFLRAAHGPRVIGIDLPDGSSVAASVAAAGLELLTFGTDASAALRIDEFDSTRDGCSFGLAHPGGHRATVALGVPGLHNARNATAALGAALALGIDLATVTGALGRYREVARRFEWRGEHQGVTYVDDYAHLPSAVAATLAAARAGGWRRVVAVFQPHRYSRTEALHGAFADVFGDADVVVVTDVYPAGEDPRPGVSGALVADAVSRSHSHVTYVADRRALAGALAGLVRPGDLCVTLGAGDITTLAGEMMGRSDG